MTDYVTLCHQDDIYMSSYLENIEHCMQHNDILIISTDYSEIKDNRNYFTESQSGHKKVNALPF